MPVFRFTPFIDLKLAERLQRKYNEAVAVARAMGISVEEMLAEDETAKSAGDFGAQSNAAFDADEDGAEQDRADTPGDAGESGTPEEDSRQADMFGF